MTTKVKHRISTLPVRKKNKYYREHSEGYGFQNGEFCFSDDILDWQLGKTRKFKQQSKPLF